MSVNRFDFDCDGRKYAIMPIKIGKFFEKYNIPKKVIGEWFRDWINEEFEENPYIIPKPHEWNEDYGAPYTFVLSVIWDLAEEYTAEAIEKEKENDPDTN